MKSLTKDIVLRRIASRGITIVGEYINVKTKTMFQCKEGHVWGAPASNVMHGTGCPECSGNIRLNKTLVNERLADRKITMTGSYINARHKTEFRCPNGHTWQAIPDSVMRGRGVSSL
jgi:hypothetical protein